MSYPATAAVRLLTGEREPVRLATTGNIDVDTGGLVVVDGVQTAVGDRILLTGQTDGSENGIRTASEGQWYRAADARTARTMQKGTTVAVQEGTYAGKYFIFNTLAPVIGDDSLSITVIPNAILETQFIDEDDMVSNSDTKVPSQQSVKAYVDASPATAAAQAVMRDRIDAAPYVATRTALKALDTTKDTTAILTEAGRQGVFVWTTGNFSSQITADTAEGIYVKANAIASTAGAWVRSYAGLANVKWFGATGDGVANENTALAAAIASGKSLFFPEGTYLITAALTLSTAGQFIVGEGNRKSYIKTSGNAFAAITLGASSTGVDKIGFTSTAQRASGAFVSIGATYENFVERCGFTNGYQGILVTDAINTFIETSSFTTNARGIEINGGNDTYLSRLAISGGGANEGIYIIRTGAIIASDIDIVLCNYGIRMLTDGTNNISWSFFSNILVDTSNQAGLQILSSGTSAVKGLFFTNCWFATSGTHGLLVQNTGATDFVSGLTFSGCRFVNNAQHGATLVATSGGLIRDITFSGCTSSGNSTAASNTNDGLRFEKVEDFIVTGCMIKQTAGLQNTQRYGVNITAGCARYTINNNDLYNNVTAGLIDATNDANSFILNNIGFSDLIAWTPVLAGTTAAGAGTYSTQVGTIRKEGKKVDFTLRLDWSAHTGTGNMIITGLPFTSANQHQPVTIYGSNLTFPGQLVAFVAASSTQITLQTIATGAAGAALAMDTSATIILSGFYFTS